MSNSKGSIQRTCKTCGTEFKTKMCWIRKGYGKFCSKPCADQALKVSPETRFWVSVDKSGGPDACWPWTKGRRRGGYGQIYVNGKAVSANRFSYELHYGLIPNGMIVLHKCDNPPCCNPAHLQLGTYAENSADMVAKDRQAKGERHGSRTCPGAVKKAIPRGERHSNAKLTATSAKEITAVYKAGGITMRALAERYGVHLVTISDVVNGKTWTEVTMQPCEAQ